MIQTLEELDERLSRPSAEAVGAMGRMEGDLVILGVAGKMGPTLARMARRACDEAGVKKRIIGVARFSDAAAEGQLRAWGVETIRADLLEPEAVRRLPEVPNVLFMAGMKFGSTGNECTTWAMNVSVPTLAAIRYAGSKIVAFSSGNVYGLVPVTGSGSRESDRPSPVGEYAMSVLGRERVFEHYARALHSPTALLRLNYATELRYGVLVDLARWVHEEQPIDLAMGYTNVIWQGDANAMTLAAFDHVSVPAKVLNIAGEPVLRLRDVAERFGKIMNKPVRFTGTEAADALLNDGSHGRALLGRQTVTSEEMMQWIASWVMRGGASLNKPTHFENRAGKF